jgi:hypothetical protein
MNTPTPQPSAGFGPHESFLFYTATLFPSVRELLRRHRGRLAAVEEWIPEVRLLIALADSQAVPEQVVAAMSAEDQAILEDDVLYGRGLDPADMNASLATSALLLLFDKALFRKHTAILGALVKADEMPVEELNKLLKQAKEVAEEIKTSGAADRLKRPSLTEQLETSARPLLDLPADHPVRQHFESDPCTHGWETTLTPEGWEVFSTNNHKLAIGQLQKMAPELLKSEMHPVQTTIQCLELYHETEDVAMVVIAMWMPPDADDPERRESGWAVSILKGTKKDAEGLRREADRRAKAALSP